MFVIFNARSRSPQLEKKNPTPCRSKKQQVIFLDATEPAA